jgi:adenylate kinase family enzyme
MARPSAVLLIGPTGVGKTPLGDLLDREGMWNRRCCHFDFGERMRQIVAGGPGGTGVPPVRGRAVPALLPVNSTGETPVGPTGKMPVPPRRQLVSGDPTAAGDTALGPADVEFLRQVLASGALLEDEHFHIAEKILRAFLAERRVGAKDLVVLNGLPRHVGQADDVAAIVNVRAVVELACPADAVLARIRTNAGGDRAERGDDDDAAVRAKLAIYGGRTALLLDYYRRHGTAVLTVDIGAETTAQRALAALQGRPCPTGV